MERALRVHSDGRNGRIFADEAGLALLSALGLSDHAAVMAYAGGVVCSAGRTRAVRRIETPGGVFYLKQIRKTGRADFIRDLLSGRGRRSMAAREYANARTLESHGIKMADVVAFGEDLGAFGERSSFLLTREAAGFALDAWLAGRVAERDRRTDRLVRRAVEELVGALLRAGVLVHDLAPKHIYIDIRDEAAVKTTLIDVPRIAVGGSLPERRAAICARVAVEIPFHVYSRADRERFLRSVFGADLDRERPLLARAVENLVEKRRFRRHLVTEPPARIPVPWRRAADGLVVYDARAEKDLRSAGIDLERPDDPALATRAAAAGLIFSAGSIDAVRLLWDAHDLVADWRPTADLLARYVPKKKTDRAWMIRRFPKGESPTVKSADLTAEAADLDCLLTVIVRLGYRLPRPLARHFIRTPQGLVFAPEAILPLLPGRTKEETEALRQDLRREWTGAGWSAEEVDRLVRSIRFRVRRPLGRTVPVEKAVRES